MNLTKNKIKNAVVCAKRVLEQADVFDGRSENLPISVDAVTDFIADHCGVAIEIRDVVFEASYLKGRKETYRTAAGTKVVIEIRNDLSDAWKRFVAIKELMHIIVDKDDDDLTPYGDVILEKLVLEGHIGVISGIGDDAPAQSELVAEVSAIEVIYPIGRRRADKARLLDEADDLTQSQLELAYRAPGPIVSTALNDNYIAFIVEALTPDNI